MSIQRWRLSHVASRPATYVFAGDVTEFAPVEEAVAAELLDLAASVADDGIPLRLFMIYEWLPECGLPIIQQWESIGRRLEELSARGLPVCLMGSVARRLARAVQDPSLAASRRVVRQLGGDLRRERYWETTSFVNAVGMGVQPTPDVAVPPPHMYVQHFHHSWQDQMRCQRRRV